MGLMGTGWFWVRFGASFCAMVWVRCGFRSIWNNPFCMMCVRAILDLYWDVGRLRKNKFQKKKEISPLYLLLHVVAAGLWLGQL